MFLIYVNKIFSQYHVCSLTDSYFAQILKMALLSISLNLETQYMFSYESNLELSMAKKLFIWFT